MYITYFWEVFFIVGYVYLQGIFWFLFRADSLLVDKYMLCKKLPSSQQLQLSNHTYVHVYVCTQWQIQRGFHGFHGTPSFEGPPLKILCNCTSYVNYAHTGATHSHWSYALQLQQ